LSYSYKDREKNIHRMASEEFDLAIIGGGITGAGIARDAASRGLRVALVEANDFASGTSSRSSKLIHGGVRYLENLEFGLVFEALSERAQLFKMAPHLVHPLRFMIPVYESSRVGLWKLRLGMWLYDLLALFETPQMHESLDPDEVAERVPGIETQGLTGAVEYSDAYTDDDRLVIETLRDAHRMGAVSANYTKVIAGIRQGEVIQSLEVNDQLSGQTFMLKAKQVVSGVGPWTDVLGHHLDPKDWQNRLRPTKGVHLVFSKKRIPIKKAIVMAVEKRIIFVIPRHDMVIVGTTDTDYKEQPENVNTDIADVNYIMNALAKYFPQFHLRHSDIISSYAGVRPLVNDGSDSEGKTSREHSIFSHGDNLTFVAGGKYTTYRLISQQAVDFALKKMSFEDRMSFGPSQTMAPLNPEITSDSYQAAIDSVEYLAAHYGIELGVVARLVFRYGNEAKVLLKWIKEDYSHYSSNEALWMSEARFAIEQTMCMSLKDFYWRRSPLFLSTKSHGFNLSKPIMKVFKDNLGWDESRCQKEEKLVLDSMHQELAWREQTDEFVAQ
jgi:glycerol-3-phosphate dehydrogenase